MASTQQSLPDFLAGREAGITQKHQSHIYAAEKLNGARDELSPALIKLGERYAHDLPTVPDAFSSEHAFDIPYQHALTGLQLQQLEKIIGGVEPSFACKVLFRVQVSPAGTVIQVVFDNTALPKLGLPQTTTYTTHVDSFLHTRRLFTRSKSAVSGQAKALPSFLQGRDNGISEKQREHVYSIAELEEEADVELTPELVEEGVNNAYKWLQSGEIFHDKHTFGIDAKYVLSQADYEQLKNNYGGDALDFRCKLSLLISAHPTEGLCCKIVIGNTALRYFNRLRSTIICLTVDTFLHTPRLFNYGKDISDARTASDVKRVLDFLLPNRKGLILKIFGTSVVAEWTFRFLALYPAGRIERVMLQGGSATSAPKLAEKFAELSFPIEPVTHNGRLNEVDTLVTATIANRPLDTDVLPKREMVSLNLGGNEITSGRIEFVAEHGRLYNDGVLQGIHRGIQPVSLHVMRLALAAGEDAEEIAKQIGVRDFTKMSKPEPLADDEPAHVDCIGTGALDHGVQNEFFRAMKAANLA